MKAKSKRAKRMKKRLTNAEVAQVVVPVVEKPKSFFKRKKDE